MRNFVLDVKIAKKNLSKIQSLIPRKLRVKEDNIAKNQVKNSKTSSNKMVELHKLADELTSKISSLTPCKSGCSNCCHINVSVSELEAMIISDETGFVLNSTDIASKVDFHGTRCLFLTNDRCSIYSVRPYFCRRFVSLMPNEYWCHHERNLEHELPLLGFSGMDKAYWQLASRGTMKDIRQWFNFKV